MATSTINFYQGTVFDELFTINNGDKCVIDASGGDDKVNARTVGLNDLLIYGGALHDILEAGSGADTIFGDRLEDGHEGDRNNAGFDRDYILGGGNNDTIFGQGGGDSINGENGDDFISGGVLGDFLQGGSGNDRVYGGADNDIIFGGTADPASVPTVTVDLIKNGKTGLDLQLGGVPVQTFSDEGEDAQINTGDDILSGGTGNDTINGQDGDDNISGGNGNDNLVGGAGADHIDGGNGIDNVSYAGSTAVKVNLGTAAAQTGGGAAGDTLANVENVVGSAFGDTLIGSAAANSIIGGAGRDFLTGGAGLDSFRFLALGDTGVAGGSQDVISDFRQVQHDRIRLSDIDADQTAGGNQAFAFIGTGSFSANDPGEVRAIQSGANTLVQLNTDNDIGAEAIIRLTGNFTLLAGNFVL